MAELPVPVTEADGRLRAVIESVSPCVDADRRRREPGGGRGEP